MKKKFTIYLLCVIMVLSVVLAACDNTTNDNHTHKYGVGWTSDATHHWHAAICEHTDEVKDKAAHDFDHGTCTVCNYTDPDYEEVIEARFEYEKYTGNGSTSGSEAIVMPTDIPEKAASPSLKIYYYRTNSKDYKTWGYWLWEKAPIGSDGKLFKIGYQDEETTASVTIVPLTSISGNPTQIGLIPRMQAAWTKDGDADRIIDLADYQLDENNYYNLYIVQNDLAFYKDVETFKNQIEKMKKGVSSEFKSEKQITITTKVPVTNVKILEGDTVLGEMATEPTCNIRYFFASNHKPDLNKSYNVEVEVQSGDKITSNVSCTALYTTDLFNNTFYFEDELGALYSKDSTEFRVWSPLSTRIVLKIYDKGDGPVAPSQTVEMTKGDRGVFITTLTGDLAGKYYTYTVYNSSYPSGAEIVDPYAKSAGLNGARGQIVNFEETNPDGWEKVTPYQYDRNELVVWETHVSDVTSSSTWTGTEANRKKFLGMIESGTTYTQGGVTVKTGFDHIVELGVNAVQLVPIYDQNNNESTMTFNWGYNPLNYNVLEGSYSSNPSDGYARIREFKQLVQAFNGQGINIIMDVVYNHVAAASGSNFDVLMPGYFYRYTADGSFSNGSGCGNETASEHLMFRKFMIDSVCFWAKEYKLGGFRFDLMGLHDIETMNQLAAALQKINPGIVVYGEPWTGGTSTLPASQQAKQANANKLEGVGQFNDQMRDALIKGGLNSKESKGWVTNKAGSASDVSNIINGLVGYTGGTIRDMYKTVNYVTCHDNYTLYDRIVASGTTDEDTIRKMAMLANSVVLTSNGVNFMLAGEEFLRTKGGDDNSYESSYKVNELDYALKIKNADIFANYQKLIAFKQTFVEMGLTSNSAVSSIYTATANGGVIMITIKATNGTTWKIAHGNGAASGTVNFDGYTLYLDTLNTSGLTLNASTPISAYQTIIAKK